LGIGDWPQSPIPNPQSPIPNPQSPCFQNITFLKLIFLKIINYSLLIKVKNKKMENIEKENKSDLIINKNMLLFDIEKLIQFK